MTARPYRQLRVEELDRLFAAAPQDAARLHAILGELEYRSTVRALDLKRRLEDHLKSGQGASLNTSGTAPTQPQPTAQPAPVAQSDTSPGSAADDRSREDARRPEPNKLYVGSPPETMESAVHTESMEQPSATSAPAHAPKPEMSQEQRGVTQLIDYLHVLIELADKPVWSLSSYNNLVLYEDELRNRVGIRHDLTDLDGPVYLKIDRLRRTDPPEPPEIAKDWLTIARDPFKEPIVQSFRTTVMTAAESERLVAEGTVDQADVTKTLKPKPGQDLRDVVLRLARFPDNKSKIEHYIAHPWSVWAEAERPRRETIDIYDRLFSLQQALKLEGADRPLEVVWGMGVARWKLPPHELNHPIVEQLVELELDDAAAIIVRPRGVDPIMAFKPFAAMENPGTDLVARFAREHFAKLPPDRDLSPFEKDTFTPILRYASAQFDRAGRYYPDQVPPDDRRVPLVGSNLVITDTWVIYARPRSENFFTADLERLRKAVEVTAPLPGPTVALVTKPADEPTYVPSFMGGGFRGAGTSAAPAAASITDARAASEQASGSRYFFPKPFNEEQIAIVERLERKEVEGVVVQGPPGTGKTHTIANIICHYLATGRRVLVTSKSEGALAVLRDQIPEGIRDLTISLLTSEREGLKQLEATVNLLASKIASLDPRPAERDIAESEERIAERQRQIDKVDIEMRRFADRHLRRINASADTDGILPIELAERIIRDHDHYAWFPDRRGCPGVC
jgi:hypothetical protein